MNRYNIFTQGKNKCIGFDLSQGISLPLPPDLENEITYRNRELEKILDENDAEKTLILDEGHIAYFTGYRGAGLYVYNVGGEAKLYVPLMEYWKAVQASSGTVSIIPFTRIVYNPDAPYHQVEGTIKDIMLSEIGEKKVCLDSKAMRTEVAREKRDKNVLIDVDEKIWKLRRRKTETELKYLKIAVEITEKALWKTIEEITLGVTERSLYLKLLSNIYSEGGQGVGFDPIVAVDDNAANPHAIPGNRRVKKDSIILIDVGARVHGYTADMTRTIVPRNSVWESLRDNIIQAIEEAIEYYKPGKKVVEAEKASRTRLRLRAKDKYFIHSLGHGVGLDVHEKPWVSLASVDTFLKGDVVTVEPGVYFPKIGGIRIEDMVYIGDEKGEKLNSMPRKIEN